MICRLQTLGKPIRVFVIIQLNSRSATLLNWFTAGWRCEFSSNFTLLKLLKSYNAILLKVLKFPKPLFHISGFANNYSRIFALIWNHTLPVFAAIYLIKSINLPGISFEYSILKMQRRRTVTGVFLVLVFYLTPALVTPATCAQIHTKSVENLCSAALYYRLQLFRLLTMTCKKQPCFGYR